MDEVSLLPEIWRNRICELVTQLPLLVYRIVKEKKIP